MTIGFNFKKGRGSLPQKKPPMEKGRWASKGNKPLPEQATVKQIFVILIVHSCRKVLFIQTEVKITLYAMALFFGSLICDFLPIPTIYLANRDNILHLYFVRLAWFWTVLIVGFFIYMTSVTYSCGRKQIVKKHLMRIVIGTILWFIWTQVVFAKIEKMTGVCLGKSIFNEKLQCIVNGYQWHAFNISEPAFVLIYVNLLLVEEAKAIIGWEGIKDLIRVDEHNRIHRPEEAEDSSLSHLTLYELFNLKDNYTFWTPYIRTLFLFMTILSLLCDVMIACVVIYYSTMPTKVAGGAIAIATWYITYRCWFKKFKFPGLPGSGYFTYQLIDRKHCLVRRNSSFHKERKIPNTFMGMPIHVAKEDENDSDAVN